jgi:hypothetical protein
MVTDTAPVKPCPEMVNSYNPLVYPEEALIPEMEATTFAT